MKKIIMLFLLQLVFGGAFSQVVAIDRMDSRYIKYADSLQTYRNHNLRISYIRKLNKRTDFTAKQLDSAANYYTRIFPVNDKITRLGVDSVFATLRGTDGKSSQLCDHKRIYKPKSIVELLDIKKLYYKSVVFMPTKTKKVTIEDYRNGKIISRNYYTSIP